MNLSVVSYPESKDSVVSLKLVESKAIEEFSLVDDGETLTLARNSGAMTNASITSSIMR